MIYSLFVLLPREPVHCSMSSSKCCFLTCIYVSQKAGKVVWNSHLFKNFPVCCDPHKGFHIVNEAEVDAFLEFLCFFYDTEDFVNLNSGSSVVSESSLYIWKFSVHIMLKPSLKDFEHNLASMQYECNCIIWTFFEVAFLWDWNENWSFPVLWSLLSLPSLLAH